MFFSIGWTLYLIFSNYGSDCFDTFKTYITLVALILNLVWNNLIIKQGDEL